MFDGNTNLDPDSTYGTQAPLGDLTPFSAVGDFQINYRSLLAPSNTGNDILFITADHVVWGMMHWETAFPLQAVFPFNSVGGISLQSYCCSGGNVVWKSCTGVVGLGVQKNCGHILFRGTATEDPWISTAHGNHNAGYLKNLGFMIWGEDNYGLR